MFGDFGLDTIAPKKDESPSEMETIWYLFWRKGIDLTSFNTLPIPYIMSMLKTYSYYKEKEAEAAKKK